MPRNTRGQRWNTRWRRMPPWGKVGVVTGVVVGLSGSVTGVRAAWPVVKMWMPAPIVYVDGSIEEAEGRIRMAQQTNTSILRDLQLETAEGKKESAAQNKAKWQVERSKIQDPATLGLIDQQLNELDKTISRINSQIRVIEKLKANGQ